MTLTMTLQTCIWLVQLGFFSWESKTHNTVLQVFNVLLLVAVVVIVVTINSSSSCSSVVVVGTFVCVVSHTLSRIHNWRHTKTFTLLLAFIRLLVEQTTAHIHIQDSWEQCYNYQIHNVRQLLHTKDNNHNGDDGNTLRKQSMGFGISQGWGEGGGGG